MTDTQYFHFTLGPVQSFVAQARRTRDFWAGSFLLSWLSAVAMREVEAQCGPDSIVFPGLDPAFREALTTLSEHGPQQGSVPNRFKARVHGHFDPDKVVAAVRIAWSELAETVWRIDLMTTDWERYGKPESKTGESKTRRLWRQQVDYFWDIAWVITDDDCSDALDRRKNWRTYLPPPQSGLKCALMEGWQELAAGKPQYEGGEKRDDRGRKGKPGRLVQSAKDHAAEFWRTLHRNTALGLDLSEDEFLCAIAFIKRRFHRHFHTLRDVPMPSGWRLQGWRLEVFVPAVSYLAAAHWLAELIADESVPVEKLDELYRLGRKIADHDERNTRIRCIVDAHAGRPAAPRGLSQLDGSLFFPDLYASQFKTADPARQKASEANQTAMRDALNRVGRPLPPPFYALVLMDGDSLGKLLSQEGNQSIATTALGNFTGRVPGIVEAYNGFLVYAGGDDVLALLPVRDALDGTRQLREAYRDSFAKAGWPADRPPATISAAVQFIHVHCPLTRVLRDAHHLLDKIAKDGCGRDALAVRVVKPGGAVAEWAMRWEYALAPDGARLEIQHLVERFKADQDEDTGFSGKFFHGVRDLFDKLVVKDPRGASKETLLGKTDFVDLLWADFVASGLNREGRHTRESLDSDLAGLFEQCRPKARRQGRDGAVYDELGAPRADAALLIRFLATLGG
jgi:CRISPR-associated protein Cmr2